MSSFSQLLVEVLKTSAENQLKQSSQSLKIESVKKYLQAIQAVRSLYLLSVCTKFVLFISAASFFAAIFYGIQSLPIGGTVQSLVFFAVFCGVFVIAISVFFYLNSQRRWMQLSRADEMLERVLRDHLS